MLQIQLHNNQLSHLHRPTAVRNDRKALLSSVFNFVKQGRYERTDTSLIKGGKMFHFHLSFIRFPQDERCDFLEKITVMTEVHRELSISTWSSKFILPYCFYFYLGSTVRGHVKARNYLLIEIIFSYFPSLFL